MSYLFYFFQLVLLQYTSAQLLTLGRNLISNQNCNNIPIGTNLANNGLFTNIGQPTYELATNIVATPMNNRAQEYLNANLMNNANYGNIANANIGLASSNIGLANGNIGLTSGNIGLANGNIGLATGNIGVATGNIGSESAIVYKKQVPTYANVVKPPREYGIEFSSSALQVGGNVEVSGSMPFSTNVAVSGTVPTQGQGAVEYKCDKLGGDES